MKVITVMDYVSTDSSMQLSLLCFYAIYSLYKGMQKVQL